MKLYEIKNVFNEKVYGRVTASSDSQAMEFVGIDDPDAWAFPLSTKRVKIERSEE